jgi:Sec-independent protein secretion pathway component TatC
MMEKIEGYRRYLYISANIIAIGITLTTLLKDTVGSIGVVFIAIGGLFFIIGMRKKQKEDEQKKK